MSEVYFILTSQKGNIFLVFDINLVRGKSCEVFDINYLQIYLYGNNENKTLRGMIIFWSILLGNINYHRKYWPVKSALFIK